jgi:uncharacterized protein YndB with AHSA1/START domain
MSTVIGSARSRVWRALTAPGEMIRWDERAVALLDPADDYPAVGRAVRWRYRVGTVPVVLHDRPLEVVAGQRLRSRIDLGLFHFDGTYALADEPGSPDRTRVTLKLVAENSVPVVGGLLDRFGVRRIGAQLADSRLRQLQKWCENRP